MKKPLFTGAAILTLALGIGANTAIFSVVNAVLLRSLPYPSPDRLITLRSNESVPDADDLRIRCPSIESFGAVVIQDFDYTSEGEPLKVSTGLVNGDLFSAIGIPPQYGRTINSADDQNGTGGVVVLSNGFWQRHFGGNPAVIGNGISLSGVNYTIVGIMPDGFSLPRDRADIYAPIRVANPLAAGARGVHFLHTYLRLKPGATLSTAQAELDAASKWLGQTYPDENKDRRRIAFGLKERLVGDQRQTLLILFGAVGFVLLVACANFSSLLLARAASRHQELAIRTALGASRWRIIRQVITESTLLALAGGCAGLLLAMWGIDLLIQLKPEALRFTRPVQIDTNVLWFTFGVAVVAGVVFGLIPALNAIKQNTGESLKELGRGTVSGRKHRVRNTLVVSEIALALMLLTGAGLLIRAFWKLRNVDPGFETAHLTTMRLELPETRYKEIPTQTRFRKALLERLNAIPGAEAAMISELPLSGSQLTHNAVIEGLPPVAIGDEPEINTRNIGGDYFKIMHIPVLRGRDLSPRDDAGQPTVGVVNQSFVNTYFPGKDVIGTRIKWARGPNPPWMTIVGVVGDVKHFGLELPEEPAFYYSYMQADQPWKRWMYIVVKSNQDSAAISRQVKNQIWALDKLLPVSKVESMQDVVAISTASQRFNTALMAAFALVALLLAAIGIYSLMAFAVTHRTHEIGLRMALGAQAHQVLTLILRQGMTLALLGVMFGLAGSLIVTRLMQSLLFGVSATDPLTLIVVAGTLSLVALLACLLPARRASRIDPMVALRYE